MRARAFPDATPIGWPTDSDIQINVRHDREADGKSLLMSPRGIPEPWLLLTASGAFKRAVLEAFQS
jgi:hypothetical protein